MENDLRRDKRLELKREYGTANNMSQSEKQISFLNRYFVYKKVRNVDIHNVSESMKPDHDAKAQAPEDAAQAPAAQAPAAQDDEEKGTALKEAQIIIDAKSALDNAHKEEQVELLEKQLPPTTKPKKSRKPKRKITILE